MRVEIVSSIGRTIVIDDRILAEHREALAERELPAPARSAWAATRVVRLADYSRVPHSVERPGVCSPTWVRRQRLKTCLIGTLVYNAIASNTHTIIS